MRLYVDVLPWSRKDEESTRNPDTNAQKSAPHTFLDGEVAALAAGEDSVGQR